MLQRDAKDWKVRDSAYFELHAFYAHAHPSIYFSSHTRVKIITRSSASLNIVFGRQKTKSSVPIGRRFSAITPIRKPQPVALRTTVSSNVFRKPPRCC